MNLTELRTQGAQIEARICALSDEISATAVTALNGGGEAAYKQALAKQAERRELQDRLELIEAAQTELQRQERERQAKAAIDGRMREIRRNVANWRRAIAREVRVQYQNTAWHISKLVNAKLYGEAQAHWLGLSLPGQFGNAAQKPVGAVNMARHLARGLLEPFCTRQQRTSHPADPRQSVVTDVVDEALLEQMIGEMLDGLELPPLPATLGEFLALYERKPDPPRQIEAPEVIAQQQANDGEARAHLLRTPRPGAPSTDAVRPARPDPSPEPSQPAPSPQREYTAAEIARLRAQDLKNHKPPPHVPGTTRRIR